MLYLNFLIFQSVLYLFNNFFLGVIQLLCCVPQLCVIRIFSLHTSLRCADAGGCGDKKGRQGEWLGAGMPKINIATYLEWRSGMCSLSQLRLLFLLPP